HFASADLPEKAEFTREQMARFESAVELVRSRGHLPRWVHQANSAAAHAIPAARGNIVRLGGAIYGLWRDTTNPTVEPLAWQPVMSLHTRVTYMKTVAAGTALGYGSTHVTSRESCIAILPVGYADGLSRMLSNCGRVLVRGRFAPIIGRVSMDLTIVDVTGIPGVEIDDEAVIIGRQGGCEITAEEMAGHIGTIAYEVTCGISDRVPRVYIRQKLP
ncbi:MAG TPA: alanine racemase, partial [Blastocatellia bacterium]|nr:alanine racemase [Blastocatellia bacterium]